MTTWLRTFEAEMGGGVQEDRFEYSDSIAIGSGVEVLYNSPVYISQMYVSWTSSATVTLTVQLPSGAEYTVKAYSSATSFLLNGLDGGNGFIYWMQLPTGSRLRFAVSVNSISALKISVISNPL